MKKYISKHKTFYNVSLSSCSLSDQTMAWKHFLCKCHHNKETESISYQNGIMLQPCCSILWSSCSRRQIQSGFVFTTDLPDLWSLNIHTKKQYNWLSRKSCKHSSWWQLNVESSHCYPCTLFLNRPITFPL